MLVKTIFNLEEVKPNEHPYLWKGGMYDFNVFTLTVQVYARGSQHFECLHKGLRTNLVTWKLI